MVTPVVQKRKESRKASGSGSVIAFGNSFACISWDCNSPCCNAYASEKEAIGIRFTLRYYDRTYAAGRTNPRISQTAASEHERTRAAEHGLRRGGAACDSVHGVDPSGTDAEQPGCSSSRLVPRRIEYRRA